MNPLKNLAVILAAGVVLSSCTKEAKQANYNVIPLPQEIITNQDAPFTISKSTQILYPEGNADLERTANFLSQYLDKSAGLKLAVKPGNDGANTIILNDNLQSENKEAYQINISSDKVTITGASAAGTFYGVQTIRKSVPSGIKGFDITLPSGTINDAPRFGYRGGMLDVGRHFFSLDSVKQFIDILALHNINTMHWHISDDQGWRIEIKKYPKLTEVGSTRKQTVIGHNTGEFDGKPYGGFYTQEEAKEIIQYAKDRFINVIPEIDMPGHMLAALTSYPELGCTGGPYDVAQKWGVFDDVLCVGKDTTMQFVKDVLAEIIDIFPSKYIHLGGDECPKVRWEKCPVCQTKIKELGLKSDEHHTAEQRLQSYCMQTAEKFLNDNGRQMIGWDEVLEGGVAPNATIMSWRGIAGGVDAARQGHDVIMTPSSHLYFDYYQTADTQNEPMAIGGFLPISTVYGFEPLPSELTDEQKKHIIGVQANLWTEYITTFDQVQYMLMPRMAALSEIQWMNEGKRNYEDFLTRLPQLIQIYDNENYNYGKHLFNITALVESKAGEKVIEIKLSTIDNADIYYTLDGTKPSKSSNKYTEPIKIDKSCTFKAMAIRPSGESPVYTDNILFSKSTFKPAVLNSEPYNRYTFKGAPTFTDGLKGDENYHSGRWIGYNPTDLDVTIDLEKVTEISKAGIATNVVKGDWIMDAKNISISISEDGKNFKEIVTKEYPSLKDGDPDGIFNHDIEFAPVQGQFVRIVVKHDMLPEWHPGAGKTAFVFVDEIVLD